MTCKGGQRWSTYEAYLKPAMGRPNLTVATGALAARVELDGDRATGVTFRQGGREHTVARAPRGAAQRRRHQLARSC